VFGFIVNVNSKSFFDLIVSYHWAAVCRIEGHFFLIDSLKSKPQEVEVCGDGIALALVWFVLVIVVFVVFCSFFSTILFFILRLPTIFRRLSPKMAKSSLSARRSTNRIGWNEIDRDACVLAINLLMIECCSVKLAE
jgi:hypothetical protein